MTLRLREPVLLVLSWSTSLVHSLYYNLCAYQIDCLQSIQNCLAHTVCRASKFSHITPTLQSLHWLKVKQHIEYKIVSLTYYAVQFHQPSYLSNLLIQQPNIYNTCSSALITLKRPASRAAVAKHSFYHSAPALWNLLPPVFHQPACRSREPNKTLVLSRDIFLIYLFSQSFPP